MILVQEKWQIKRSMLSSCSFRFQSFLKSNNVTKSISRHLSRKTRTIIDPSLEVPSSGIVKLNPFNKLRTIAKKSYLPVSHVSKALCTREGKFFYLNVDLNEQNEI